MNIGSKHLDDWFRKNDSLIQTIHDHPQLRKILQNNQKLRTMNHDDLNKILLQAAINMKELNTLAIAKLETLVEVLLLVLEIISMALKQLHKSYATFAKIPLWMLKTNKHLVEDTCDIVTIAINSFCGDFCWLRKQVASSSDEAGNSKYLQLIAIPLALVDNTQKMFPNNHGTPGILLTAMEIVSLGQISRVSKEAKEFDYKFTDIIVQQRVAASYYTDFFKAFTDCTDQQLISVLSFCNGTAEDLSYDPELLEKAMRREEDENFCLLLIEFLAENPQSIHLCPELYSQLLSLMTELILSEDLSVQSFQFIEKALVVKICSDDFWQSLISYQIFREMLIQLRSITAIAKYRQFFPKLFARFPGRSICSFPKLLIMSLLKLILQDLPEPGTTKEKFIDLDYIYTPGINFQAQFNEAFRELNDHPCADSFYKVVTCLKSLRTGEIDVAKPETAKNFYKLIEMTGNGDLQLHSRMICGIMDVMRSGTSDEVKMTCMVKYFSVLGGVEEMPWEVELKLLHMLFSYIPLAKEKTSLPKILTREFSKLLRDSPNRSALIRIVQRTMAENLNDWSSAPPSAQHVEFMKFLNSFNKVTSKQSIRQTLVASKKLRRFHKCAEIPHSIPLDVSSEVQSMDSPSRSKEQLQSILEYSKSLENETLTHRDFQIINEIVETLGKLSVRKFQ